MKLTKSFSVNYLQLSCIYKEAVLVYSNRANVTLILKIIVADFSMGHLLNRSTRFVAD